MLRVGVDNTRQRRAAVDTAVHLPWLLVALVAVAACTDHEEELHADANSALTTEATCELELLGGSEGPSACSGAWQYARYGSCRLSHRDCSDNGERICPAGQAASCQDFAFGINATLASRTENNHLVGCLQPGDLGLGGKFVCQVASTTRPQAQAWCNARAASALASQRANIPPAYRDRVSVTSSLTAKASETGWWDDYDCKLTVRYPTPKTGTDADICGCNVATVWPTCTLNNHPACPASELYSEVGLTLPQLQAKPGFVTDTPPMCTSCDATPLADDSAATQLRAACLIDSLERLPATRADAKLANVRNQKLLYEMRGDALTPQQQQSIRATYEQFAGVHHDCGIAVPVIPQAPPTPPGPPTEFFSLLSAPRRVTNPNSCPVSPQFLGQLELCTRLRSTHAAENVVYGQIRACFELLDRLNETGCNQEYRNLVEDSLFLSRDLPALTGKVFSSIPPGISASNDPAVRTPLQRSLATVQLVWDAVKTLPAPQAKIQLVLADFWTTAYKSTGDLPLPGDANELALIELFRHRSRVEQDVLEAAYSAEAPLHSAPLLEITADALRPLLIRMEDASALHDVACRYLGCTPRDTSELSLLWEALGALHQQARLTAAVAQLSGSRIARPEFRRGIIALASRHDLLANAYLDAQQSENPVPIETILTSPSSPRFSGGLRGLISVALDKSERHRAVGMFSTSGQNVLNEGIQESNRVGLVGNLQRRSENLSNELANYRSDRALLVQELTAELDADATFDRLQNTAGELSVELKAVADEIVGLGNRDAIERSRFGAYAQEFERTLEGRSLDPNLEISVASASFSVSANHARHNANRGLVDVSNVAVVVGEVPWKQAVQKGDILRVTTQNGWAPNCAIRKMNVLDPEGQSVPVATSPAETGPEGYSISYTDNGFQSETKRVSDVTTTTLSLNASACAGGSVSIGAGAVSVTLGSQQACVGISRDWSDVTDDSTSSGTESRWSASFSAGLRAPGTPFAAAPAGSLLMVAMKPDETAVGHVVDVQVVNPNAAFVMDQDADVYFVVNDVTGCNPVHGSVMTVNTRVSTPQGALVKLFAEAAAETTSQLRGQIRDGLRNGPFLPSEIEAFRAESRALMAGKVTGGLDAYDPVLVAMFDTWLAAELASLERQSQILRLWREMDSIFARTQTIVHDAQYGEERSKLARLLPEWRLRSLAGSQLGAQIQDVSGVLISSVYPVMSLRYPRTLSSLREEATEGNQHPLVLLKETRLDDPVDVGAERLSAVANRVATLFDDGLRSNEQQALYAIRFARPHCILGPDGTLSPQGCLQVPTPIPGCQPDATGVVPDDCVCKVDDFGGVPPACPCVPDLQGNLPDGCECMPNDRGQVPEACLASAPVWPEADESLASTAWSRLQESAFRSASLTVRPSDFYNIESVGGTLLCSQASPIIEAMSVFVELNATDDAATLNARYLASPGSIDQSLLFPTEAGTESYIMENGDWLALGNRLLFGGHEDALSVFANEELAGPLPGTVAAGLSPFSTFNVDLGRVPAAQRDNVTAITLVFKLSSRITGQPVTEPLYCSE